MKKLFLFLTVASVTNIKTGEEFSLEHFGVSRHGAMHASSAEQQLTSFFDHQEKQYNTAEDNLNTHYSGFSTVKTQPILVFTRCSFVPEKETSTVCQKKQEIEKPKEITAAQLRALPYAQRYAIAMQRVKAEDQAIRETNTAAGIKNKNDFFQKIDLEDGANRLAKRYGRTDCQNKYRCCWVCWGCVSCQCCNGMD